MPSDAQARSSHASTKADPLSTYTCSGTPREASAGRSAAASRIVSSANPNRAAITAREWSSRNANRYVLRPSSRIACSASPVQISFGRAASNRPNTGAASGALREVSPVRLNIRWIVVSSGAHPACALRIRCTCAAVRAGFSFFSAAASSITSGGVRGGDCRGDGTSASNPPWRHSRIHRSSDHRVTRTGCPAGPACSRPASSRTIAPRCRDDSAGSAASRISMYRNSPIARARSSRAFSSTSSSFFMPCGHPFQIIGNDRETVPGRAAAA